ALFGPDWTSAGRGGLIELLGDGWSDVEPDRVWGIGATHVLHLAMESLPDEDVRVEADVEAALLSSRPSQIVDVFASGRHLERWDFSISDNRAIRSAAVPLACIAMDDLGYPSIRLEFRPHFVNALSKLDPGSNDDRAHGLALFRIRRAAA